MSEYNVGMVFVRTLRTKDRGAIVCEGHSTLAFIPPWRLVRRSN